MPFQHLGEAGFTFLGVKNIALIGVGMVAEKIKSDPNWRMWTALVSVVAPVLFFVSWSHTNMIGQIELQLKPITLLVEENTDARKVGGRYTAEVAKEDKLVNRLDHTRLQKQIDHMGDMLNGVSRFHDEGNKLDKRIQRLEERVFLGNGK